MKMFLLLVFAAVDVVLAAFVTAWLVVNVVPNGESLSDAEIGPLFLSISLIPSLIFGPFIARWLADE